MYNMNLENIKDRRVLIVGMGKSGVAAAQAMLKLGANVTIQDSKERQKTDAQLLNFLEGKNVKCYFHQLPEHVADFDMIISANSKDLDSLISLKDTDRGRLLSRWIGLSILEDKDAIAREKWNKDISKKR